MPGQTEALKEYGAVSEKCAREMAKGGTFTTGSDVGISVTGFAGPDGGSETAPVGTVFIGCNFKGKTVVREHHFQGDRSSIREQAVVYALVLLRECILENFKTVFIGCNFKGKTVVREHHFQGDRSSIREQAVVYALVLLRECILENFKQKKGK